MHSPRPYPIRHKCFVTAIMMVLLLPQLGRTELTLGRKTFDDPPAKALFNPVKLSSGFKSARFRGRVGGVAFGGIAAGKDGLKVVDMSYDASRRDGERLQVVLETRAGRTRTAQAFIYDWQLIPITKFAADDQDACFTLFGRLQNQVQEKVELESKNRILNYHPAFADTLLGLRLFQADIMIFELDATDLPKDNGVYLLGNGETAPNVNVNRQAFMRFQELLRAIRIQEQKQHRSYVICDEGQQVQFEIKEGLLVMTGRPIWSCWRFKVDEDEINRLNEQAFAEAKTTLQQEFQLDAAVLTEERRTKKWSQEYISNRVSEIIDEKTSPEILDTMESYSQKVSSAVVELNGINPAVYVSLTTTMRFSALMRHFKKENSTAFQSFVGGPISSAVATPTVKTPTVMRGPQEIRPFR